MQRPATERREPRAENRPGVDEVGILDDAFGERRTRLGHERLDQPVGEPGRHLAWRLLGHLAVRPGVEAAAGLPAEVSRVDELDEAARRRLFVGLSRARLQVALVSSRRASEAMLAALDPAA